MTPGHAAKACHGPPVWRHLAHLSAVGRLHQRTAAGAGGKLQPTVEVPPLQQTRPSAERQQLADGLPMATRVAELQAQQSQLQQQIAELTAQQQQQQQGPAAVQQQRGAEPAAGWAEEARHRLEVQLAKEADRAESGKAAAAAGAGGTLAALPFVLLQASTPGVVGLEGALALAVVAVSCLLFGAVYRFALREDVHNQHLKGGVVASFGLAQGLMQAKGVVLAQLPGSSAAGTLGTPQAAAAAVAATAGQLQGGLASTVVGTGALPHAALLLGESVLTFGVAAAAVELALKQGFVKPLRGSGGRALH